MRIFLIAISLTLAALVNNLSAQNLEVKDGWFHINGKKFFVKGIGYETHTRPGQVGWIYSFDADLIRYDLQRIKNAGFNTIRTWGALSEEELILIQESGLKILFGIWIDPDGDFGNASFKSSVNAQVNTVLAYTAKYSCVIGYLIMNEPQVDHIYSAGSQNLLNLWNSVITIINEKHPGIPVSFSSAVVGDFINMNIFGFTSFNAYIYNPVTLSDSHGYAGFINYLKESRAAQKPFLITEFGLSVSPGIPSTRYSYGGNTLTQQTEGNLRMYRELIDAGAQGGCVFQYHDGWWKGGNEWVHDPVAEEWFGMIEFSNLSDKYGTPRPAWSAFEKYNKGIITSPRNEMIYNEKIPIEIFTAGDVSSFSIKANNNILLQQTVTENYYSGLLELNTTDAVKDFKLIFNFFNANGDTLKTETISILRSNTVIELPRIKMTISPAGLNPGGKNYLQYEITNNPLFTIEGNRIDYALHPHIGFSEGTARSKTFSLVNNKFTFQDNFDMPGGTKAAAFGAGLTIRYGNFTKRIFTQNILTYGNWADPIKASDVDILTGVEEIRNSNYESYLPVTIGQNYPNPFNPSTRIEYTLAAAGNVRVEIFNSIGQLINTLEDSYRSAGRYSLIWMGDNSNGEPAGSGIYYYKISAAGSVISKKMALIR